MKTSSLRWPAAVLAVSLVAGGCVSRSHPRLATASNITLATGAALLIAARVFVATEPRCKDNEGCVLFALPVAAVLFAGAALGLVTDVATLASAARTEAPSPAPPPPPAPVVLPPLPALATDVTTLALARQARMAALHGQCTAARVDLDAIGHRDAAYHDALVAQPTFATCR